jgi:hypothetical protein
MLSHTYTHTHIHTYTHTHIHTYTHTHKVRVLDISIGVVISSTRAYIALQSVSSPLPCPHHRAHDHHSRPQQAVRGRKRLDKYNEQKKVKQVGNVREHYLLREKADNVIHQIVVVQSRKVCCKRRERGKVNRLINATRQTRTIPSKALS